MRSPEVVERRTEYATPWLSVHAKETRLDAGRTETYYSIRTHDYAVVLALTRDGRIPLVRQFRPAVERRSLELPSGLVENGEAPADTVRRELVEEAGCRAGDLIPLARFDVDTGRMQTTEYAFYAPNVEIVATSPSGDEPDLEVAFVSVPELLERVRTGEFMMAAHVAVVGAALIAGILR